MFIEDNDLFYISPHWMLLVVFLIKDFNHLEIDYSSFYGWIIYRDMRMYVCACVYVCVCVCVCVS